MIRSGYHEYFDAMLATGRRRSDMSRLVHSVTAIARSFGEELEKINVTLSKTAEQLGADFARALSARGRVERLRRMGGGR